LASSIFAKMIDVRRKAAIARRQSISYWRVIWFSAIPAKPLPIRTNDFTYVAPGVKHSFENTSAKKATMLLMTFNIPARNPLASVPRRSPKSPIWTN
jgi:hypothetical protein